jgi:hypothetical protein
MLITFWDVKKGKTVINISLPSYHYNNSGSTTLHRLESSACPTHVDMSITVVRSRFIDEGIIIIFYDFWTMGHSIGCLRSLVIIKKIPSFMSKNDYFKWLMPCFYIYTSLLHCVR